VSIASFSELAKPLAVSEAKETDCGCVGMGDQPPPFMSQPEFKGCNNGNFGLKSCMQTLEQIQAEVERLPKAEQEVLRDWLENILEDELEFTDEFKAKIELGERDLREGRVRVRKP